jgi:hypothetical protein
MPDAGRFSNHTWPCLFCANNNHKTSLLTFDGTSLGIGTSSPSFSLDQRGDSGVQMSNAANSNALRFVPGSGVYNINMAGSTHELVFADINGAVELMRLTPTGLGIGTSSPGAKLGVAGNAIFSGSVSYIALSGNQTTTAAYLQYTVATSQLDMFSSGAIDFQTGASISSKMRLDSSGNLGLGVTPSAWGSGWPALQVFRAVMHSNTGDGRASFGNNYYVDGTDARYIASAHATQLMQASGEFRFFTAPSGTAGNAISFTQAMTLDASGNLVIGTTSAGAGIGFSSTIAARSATGVVEVLRGETAATSISYYWNRATSGNNKFVDFVTDTGASSRGSIDYDRAGGLVRYNTTSDYRAKDIIGPVQNSGATIDALKVYEGVMKGATRSRPMLVAHEAQEHAPYAVSGVKDEVNDDGTPKFQQMDVSSLVPLLLAEIQSLRARVAALEA